jgi:glutamyl-tRNA synthetase
MAPVKVRFAPSPTGAIHIGNARTALFNWLFARQRGGAFTLRFDDTDTARSTRAFADGIERDLSWLGVAPDAMFRQSDRLALYEAAAAKLKTAGLLYACYETPEELELRRKVLLSRKLPPVYGREALALTGADRARLEGEGRRPHWRFLLPNFGADPAAPRRTEIRWDDLCRGPQLVDLASLSDPVLVREDGSFLYTFTSVVDDAETGISHIIRGEDHVTNTGVQAALFRALGAEPPAFGHHNLLTTATGEGLSKRTGALSIASLREQGIEPMAVASLAVLTGSSENVSAARDMDELAARFDLAATSKGAARFDPADLIALNRALLRDMPFEAVKDRLAALGIAGASAEPLWLAVRGNVDHVADAATWWAVVQGEGPRGMVAGADVDFVRAAFDLLPPESSDRPWDRATFKAWADAVKAATGRGGKALFHPLRLALTGFPAGPELADLLPLLGRAGTLARRP